MESARAPIAWVEESARVEVLMHRARVPVSIASLELAGPSPLAHQAAPECAPAPRSVPEELPAPEAELESQLPLGRQQVSAAEPESEVQPHDLPPHSHAGRRQG